MRPGGGKFKGANFEGQIAKKLSEALSPLKFIRTQGSGARVGGKNFETLGQMFGEDALKLFVGDVVPVNEKEAGVTFKHSIECKFYKTPDNFPALVSGKANIFTWMKEAIDDAVKVNRNPLLIFKWNTTPVFVAQIANPKYTNRVCKISLVSQSGMHLQISYLDDLLKVPEFWFDGVLKSSPTKEILNESQESKSTQNIDQADGEEGSHQG